MKTLIAILI